MLYASISSRSLIVAHDVTQGAADSGQLLGMADAVEADLGRKPEQVLAGRRLLLGGQSCRAGGA
jgi:hypothetical protein